ncbi:hypothetical protein HJFPF1_12425 [Paramyrothecium foliicola]|nr:hypothetical protein HJFPF1_12425 [Paramyrothecium foliicola]
MDSPSLYMTTKGKGDFSSGDGYDNVDTEELQALLRLARQTALSLETELAARSSPDEIPTSIKICIEKIRATLHDLNIMHRLDDAAGLMSRAAKVIRNEQSQRREKIYKQFLIDVRDRCGAGVALLCSKSLGKRKIVDLNNRDRISLLSYLKANSDTFRHHVLDNHAVTLGITRAASVLQTTANPPPADGAAVERREYKWSSAFKANTIRAGIEYKYSEASIDDISMLGVDLAKAVQASNQYQWERQTGGLTTDCIQGLTPRNRGDITLQLLLGFDEGTEFMEQLKMRVV